MLEGLRRITRTASEVGRGARSAAHLAQVLLAAMLDGPVADDVTVLVVGLRRASSG